MTALAATGQVGRLLERLEIQVLRGERVFLLHGPAIDDVFVCRDYSVRTLEELLWQELHDAGYERIAFSKLRQPLYFRDAASLELSRPGGRPAASRELGMMRPELSGPLGRRKMPGSAPAPRRTGSAEQDGSGAAAGTLTDEHTIKMLEQFMRQAEVPTAVVVSSAEEVLRYSRAERSLASAVAEWIEDGEGMNLCLLVFHRSGLEDVVQFLSQSGRIPRLEEFVHSRQSRPGPARALSAIRHPDDVELERLVHLVRVREGLRIGDWRTLPAVIRAMAATPEFARAWQGRLRKLIDEGRPLTLDELRRRGWISGTLPDGRSAWERLRELRGLDEVKAHLESLRWRVSADAQLRARGGDSGESPSLHLVFSGNPGTGKTTVARLIGELYRDLGLLRRGHVVEAEASELIAGYVGQTAIRTNDMVDRALDGVLFIDEAYRLSQDRGGFGQQAIDTLLTRMENDRERLVVIVAGYPERMREFLDSNPGLRSRFPTSNQLEFADYDPDELRAIALDLLSRQGLVLSSELEEQLGDVVRGMHAARDASFGNARDMRDLAAELRSRWATRVQGDAGQRLEVDDLPDRYRAYVSRPAPEIGVVLAELDALVGLEPVKEVLRQLVLRLNLRKRRGQDVPVPPHLLFLGPPGTGKTTVARLFGKLMHSIGLLTKGHVIEVVRADLVGDALGQTAKLTREAVRSALDGVLFIDEAYSLAGSGIPDAFGLDAINTLTSEMENHRGRLVVIAAGYPEPMRDFLANPGLRSRFTQQVNFPSYSDAELLEILYRMADREGYRCAPGVDVRAAAWLTGQRNASPAEFGNARSVRGLLEAMEAGLAARIADCEVDADVFIPRDVPDVVF